MSSTISRSDEADVAVGIALPQYGTVASPEAILRVAVEAERMGLGSLWVSDRLLLPTRPKETFDGDPWPEIFATVYDPIEILTFAAARTRKVKLGTSVLSALFQNPVTLARRFATPDRLSDGRVIAGIGQGDFRDEFEAANVPVKRRGRGFEEFALAMRAVWGPARSASPETSTTSQNQESDRNPYNQEAFQCYWEPSLPHHSSGRQEFPTESCQLPEEALRLRS